jgi:SNF2 family DNA or RNA helicase
MLQLTQYKWVPKADAYQQAYNLLQPGIRFKKEDCLKDMPPVTFQMRDCAFSAEQNRVYKEMHDELVASVGGANVTAANAAVKLQKLLQVGVGTIYDGAGGSYAIDAAPRLQLVEELIGEASKKVLVFVPFKAALRMVAEHLRKKGYTVETVDGDTSPTERKRIFFEMQNQENPRVLVAHPKTTSHGLTMTAADTTIWYAPIFSLETFEQANNRMNRPGQKHNMTVAMIAANALERKLYAALEGKAHMQDSVLSLYKKEVGLAT